MGSEKYSLLIETLRFLELCQLYLKDEKIELKDYYRMTGVKLEFVSSILEEDQILLKENKDLRFHLNKVIMNHYLLSNSSKKIVVL
jgi:hypothetical protein